MNPGLNILDQLFLPTGEGKPETGQSAQSTGNVEGNPFAVLFDELFGQSNTDITNVLPGNAENFSMALDEASQSSDTDSAKSLLAALSGQVTLPVQAPTASLENGISLNPGDQTVSSSSIPSLDAVTVGIDGTIAQDQAADGSMFMPTDESLSLPENLPLTNDSLRRLLQEVPTEIKTGAYTVEDSQVIDKKLSLSVHPSEQPSQTVKITLPAQILNDLNQTTSVQRVSLDGMSQTEQRMEQLLSDLNFKQLEISQGIDTEASEATTIDTQKPVTVTLIAEENGSAFEIKSRLMPSNITAVENRQAAKNDLSVDKVAADTAGYQPQNNTDQENCLVLRPAQPQSASVSPERNTSEFTTGSVQTNNTAVVDPGQMEFTDKTSDISSDTDSKTTTRQVLFDIPDRLNQTLKPNGQSVMIRIQPDHLGPARLKLSLQNDTIKATLTVETHEAKALIEGSLDKLSQQLDKADIKFDQIDVNVSSDDRGDQLFNRQSDWSRRPRFINEKLDSLSFSTTESSVAMPIYETAQLGSSGVNLLA
ncbi:MAG TPA: flagellar hook-length control protein FliK [candidate division Zixibacteria bacterium]|mgnify:CR=1 FL=1|nr:flagellar hook-length control protein FliK [candidate division Zixibacteria bacterium]